MGIYARSAVSKSSISTTWTSLDLQLVHLGGGVYDRNPDSSSNPMDVDATADDITVNETAPFIFMLHVEVDWSSSNPGSTDFAEIRIDEDSGSGFGTRTWNASQYHNKASGSLALCFATSVTSGNAYRVQAQSSGPTVNFVNGSWTIWRDDTDAQAPNDAQFLTLATDADLDNERVLTPGAGIAGTDAGAGSTYTLDLDINSLTADASPDGAADYVATYDANAGAHKKVLLDNLPGGGGGGAPTDSQYVTLATDSTLSDERVLTAGTALALTDGGAGSTATLAVDITGLSAFTSPIAADTLLVYDSTAGAHKKVALSSIRQRQDAIDAATSVVTAAVASARAGPALCISFSAHVAAMEASSFSGDVVADAITALEDFEANGEWRNVGSAGARAVDAAIAALYHHQGFDNAGE